MNILRWLLSTQLKRSPKQKKNGGFTLIELLVAMILAFLVITPLMGFMVSILNTDRQEQAKATSEQEIQTAIDYIVRDLQQAVYIYDANALNTNSNTDATQSGIKDQLPAGCDATKATCQPILVFWKRENIKAVTGYSNQDDSFVYSLVAYYLIQDNSGANTTWSKAARIARFEIKDGVSNSNVTTTCPNAYDTTSTYSQCPDTGFQPLNLSAKGLTLQQKMNTWTKATADFTQVPLVLVDFIDQTTETNGAPTVKCPASFTDPSDSTKTITWSTIPADSSSTKTGFYACVVSVAPGNKSVAQIYLRGNALARINNDDTKMVYNSNQSAYFPQVNVRVEGRSFIFSK